MQINKNKEIMTKFTIETSLREANKMFFVLNDSNIEPVYEAEVNQIATNFWEIIIKEDLIQEEADDLIESMNSIFIFSGLKEFEINSDFQF